MNPANVLLVCLLPDCRRTFAPRLRPGRRPQVYCSLSCANIARAAEQHHNAALTWPHCAWSACGKRFQPSSKRQACCSRDCAMKRRVAENAMSFREPKKSRSNSPDLQPLPPPRCETCAGPVRFGSDPRTGRSTVWCAKCGERPLQRWGVVVYDQREDLESELAESVERAGKSVKNPKRPASLGDAFRQVSHKKGIAAFLGQREIEAA